MRIAFLTKPNLSYYPDPVLWKALESKNACVSQIAWDALDAAFLSQDVILLQSCRDYYRDVQGFKMFLKRAEHFPLQNAYPLIRWNMHKSYLKELERKAIPVIPTIWPKTGASIRQYMKGKAVLKPAISAGSYETRIVQENEEVMVPEGEWLLQPFLPEIMQGEWSQIFFHGEFSHCVLKKPAQGDFRVQKQHGGHYEMANPSKDARKIAEQVIRLLSYKPIYARIDGVETSQGFQVMEVELIEPDLYFHLVPQAAEKLAELLTRPL